jgi:hypothetical protein
MILDQARDLTKAYLEFFEGDNKTTVMSEILDQAINAAMQEHFSETKDLMAFAHTLYVENKSEYQLPSDCIAISNLEVGGTRHDQQHWPYIQDVIDGR